MGDPASSHNPYCAGLSRAVASQARGSEPVFIRSYEPGQGEDHLPRGLATTAFVYDNALAAIALVACGNLPEARLIGDALSKAVRADRTFHDGRIRNAYRAGPVGKGPPALPGWWDSDKKLWAEDPAQDGTATGNVAWAALALLTLHQATHDAAYLADAERLLAWIIRNTAAETEGFRGGFHGYDPAQVRLAWVSTEHNADVYAVANWLLRLTGDTKYAEAASKARRLLDASFRDDHFLLGRNPDGKPADDAMLALDVQLWPWMAVPDAPAEWRSALRFAETHLAVPGGFDFNGDRDGLWVEGTAQAALAYRMSGDLARSRAILAALRSDQTESGLLNATRSARVTTGLSIDPTSTNADFFYYRRPHLGATAWAALAATGWNPFTGRKMS
ncbi:conserved hypothetical protein (plasmid) [Nitrobacter hamburgensis X14]|uniref:Methylaspartate ammonia-lyase n=1 Tax=Nitrobacter hamburgensis (strain DSM 10229 / NCIMB 13809 / X14) TaxID=323097 RepID=Q1QG09_NITHX|nr:hypothetical protein [Nitrobacter hamburgensis]ABE64838.1 conserved hypothetical protein [Nitrobacter hamburgensis X14]